MKPAIGISYPATEQVANLLNILLSDEYVLYTKTRNAHWNITGPDFFELHGFFQMQYEGLDTMIDQIAERVRMLGHYSLGSLKDFLKVTHMEEVNHDFSNSSEIIQTLLNDHETIVRIIRNDISPISEECKDLGTADFVTGVLEQHEKMSWMLRSMLK